MDKRGFLKGLLLAHTHQGFNPRAVENMKTRAENFTKNFITVVLLAFMAVLLTAPSGGMGTLAYAQSAQPLGGAPLGSNSDADLWRAVKSGNAGNVSIQDKKSGVLVQPSGQVWRDIRNGPLFTYGATAVLGIIALLSFFYMLRGRIRIDGGKSGVNITRFNSLDRFSHWILAVSFVILGLSGLNMIYGKFLLIPVFGKSGYATIAMAGKWMHNYVAFAFILGLVLILVLWIKHNFPNKHDIIWLLKGGGMFSKGSHPPAKKFNAGQKILFWLIILCGISICVSGIALMFPFQFSLFAETFSMINVLGFNLPTELTGMEEMQLSQVWHSAMGIFMICVIIAHIYIGTLGMEGAFDAMGSGEVDKNWAKEHHSIWVEELESAEQTEATLKQAPAE